MSASLLYLTWGIRGYTYIYTPSGQKIIRIRCLEENHYSVSLSVTGEELLSPRIPGSPLLSQQQATYYYLHGLLVYNE